MDFFTLLQHDPIGALVFLLAIIAGITMHEFAHAWVAYRLGDDTPHLQGRVTLNPLAHLDPIGTLCFIFFKIGWGKPVLYNPMRLKKQIYELYIALAGPLSNLLFALFLNVLILLLGFWGNGTLTLQVFLTVASSVNVLLAAFNLLPIPPLDGSSIVAYFWPPYRSLLGSEIGIILLLIVIFIPLGPGGSILNSIISPLTILFSQITHLFGHL